MPTGRAVIFNGAGAGSGETNLVALAENGRVVAERYLAGRGASEQFAPVLRALLDAAGWDAPPDLVVAVVGPGSFTGLRASLSLAAGLASGWGCRATGVTLGAALRETIGRPDVVCVSIARRGRVFIDAPDAPVMAQQVEDVDMTGWMALAGDGADQFGGFQGEVIACVAPTAEGILRAVLKQGEHPLRVLYVDPPEAKPPAAGLRPAPV